MSQNTKLCPTCKKVRIADHEQECRGCRYAGMVRYMRSLPADLQDWEFSVCEECGSQLDSRGVCRNQNCGASPDVGRNWQ